MQTKNKLIGRLSLLLIFLLISTAALTTVSAQEEKVEIKYEVDREVGIYTKINNYFFTEDEIYFATNQGIMRIFFEAGKFRKRFIEKSSGLVPDNQINSLDFENIFIYAGTNNGLSVINILDNTKTFFSKENDNLLIDKIDVVKKTTQALYIIGENRIFRLDSDKFTELTKSVDNLEGLLKGATVTGFTVKNNNFYISTNFGLIKFSLQNNNFTPAEKLNTENIKRLKDFDFLGLGLITDKGLIITEGPENQTLNTSSGLPSSVVNDAYLDIDNDRILVATNNGIGIYSLLENDTTTTISGAALELESDNFSIIGLFGEKIRVVSENLFYEIAETKEVIVIEPEIVDLPKERELEEPTVGQETTLDLLNVFGEYSPTIYLFLTGLMILIFIVFIAGIIFYFVKPQAEKIIDKIKLIPLFQRKVKYFTKYGIFNEFFVENINTEKHNHNHYTIVKMPPEIKKMYKNLHETEVTVNLGKMARLIETERKYIGGEVKTLSYPTYATVEDFKAKFKEARIKEKTRQDELMNLVKELKVPRSRLEKLKEKRLKSIGKLPEKKKERQGKSKFELTPLEFKMEKLRESIKKEQTEVTIKKRKGIEGKLSHRLGKIQDEAPYSITWLKTPTLEEKVKMDKAKRKKIMSKIDELIIKSKAKKLSEKNGK